MAIELDAEQRRNLKKQGISPDDLIDFPCSPTWASYYAEQGITKDYPADFYRYRDNNLLQQELASIKSRLAIIETRELNGPVTKQELWELKHLVQKLTERVNFASREKVGKY